MFDGKSVLITGGTGSFGHKYTQVLVNHYRPQEGVVYSHDELKPLGKGSFTSLNSQAKL